MRILLSVRASNPPATTSGTAGPGHLPSGQTHWGYFGAVRWNSSSNIATTSIRGNVAWHTVRQNFLSGGGATTETAATYGHLAPPNALGVLIGYEAKGGGATTHGATLRVQAGGNDHLTLINAETGGTLPGRPQGTTLVPNTLQTIYYLVVGSTTLDLYVHGYSMANGDG